MWYLKFYIFAAALIIKMEIRDRIIDEATKQFFRYGIRSVTMDEIAVALGISKRTVYEIFNDKTDLILTCIKNLANKHDQVNDEVISGSPNVIEAMLRFLELGLKILNSVNPVFFTDLKKYYPAIYKSIDEENKAKRHNMTMQMLKKGLDEGLIRKDINLAIVSKIFLEQMNIAADENIFPSDEFSASEVFRNIVINFFRGISEVKGIEIIDRFLE